ncbi:MAG: dockerin type I domain-containing protein, partial [Planctomycetota bacterium]
MRTLLAADAMAAVEVDDAVLDINQDGAVGPTDVLMILDGLHQQQDSVSDLDQRMDVNADGAVSPLDAMMVIQRMGRGHGGGRHDGARPDGERGQTDDASSSQHDGDVVLAWNNLFNELLVANEADQNPGYASRAMAMLNLAIYDAVTVATGGDDTFYDYGGDVSSSGRIRARVAASEAAYTVLSELYPDQQSTIDDFRDSMRTGGRRNAASREVGRAIGNGVIEARANDGSDAIVPYTYTPGIGSFQADPLNPDVPVWGPGWGEVETFAISSADSFAPETTPPIDSPEYAASYNEVKALGSVDSATRTADQTEAGIFWAYDRVGLGTPMALFNDVLESVGVQQGNSLAENAAMYAQASVAMADAGIVAWHTKFSEEFWRPITAIRDGELDGNALTDGDLDWTALGAPDGGNDVVGFTPQFPTYISGHATFGGALFGALQEFYGTDDIAFDVTSNELEILMDNPALEAAYGLDLDDAVRTFDSFSEAMAENGRSRVYLGIHFDFDDLVGQEVGQAVATTVASEFVVPTRGGGHGGPGDPGAGPGGGPGGHGNHGGGRRGGGHGGDRLA